MAFIYYGQGVSSLYRDFVERLMSQLALRGTEITHQNVGDTVSTMDIRHTGEEGKMEVVIDRENVRVSYTVDRERKEVKKGIAGAIAGAGLGGLLGGIIRGDRDIGDVIGGAAAGGAYGHTTATRLPARSGPRLPVCLLRRSGTSRTNSRRSSKGRRRPGRRSASAAGRSGRRTRPGSKSCGNTWKNSTATSLAVQEEIELLDAEGLDIRKPRSRIDRAETLYGEAEAALEDGNHAVVKAKAKAARAMVEGAQDLLSSIGAE